MQKIMLTALNVGHRVRVTKPVTGWCEESAKHQAGEGKGSIDRSYIVNRLVR
jgi:hypothetical protein